MKELMGAFQKLRAAFGRPAATSPAPEVVTHDPAASKPHDLDDPFHDIEAQERIGAAIAKAAKTD
jgi:hypothetical protein